VDTRLAETQLTREYVITGDVEPIQDYGGTRVIPGRVSITVTSSNDPEDPEPTWNAEVWGPALNANGMPGKRSTTVRYWQHNASAPEWLRNLADAEVRTFGTVS